MNSQFINLKQFCESLSLRYYCTQPFTLSGKTMATNGHWLAITEFDNQFRPLSELVHEAEVLEKIVTKIESIIHYFETQIFTPLPDIVLPNAETCLACLGSGKCESVWCADCEGSGHDQSTSGECQTCNGSGVIYTHSNTAICPCCHGLRKRYSFVSGTKVLGIEIDPNYLAHILTPNTTIVSIPENQMLLARLGKFSIALMGLV